MPRGKPGRRVLNVRRSPGEIVRAVDERWTEAWLAAIDPSPVESLARARQKLLAVHGRPPEPEAQLLAVAALTVASMHLQRAAQALHNPKRKRQSWLQADVSRTAEIVVKLTSKAARGETR